MDLNALRDKAYKNACKHGFHEKDLGDDCYLMLVTCELAEAVEADRKGRVGLKSKKLFEMDYNYFPDLEKEEKRFKYSFEKHVKDTLPDELADTVIRLLDLAGLRGIDLSDIYVWDFITMKDFPVYIFAIIGRLHDIPIERAVVSAISNVFSYCKVANIDLLWHIEMKMKYNELREYKHGKRY